MPADDKPVLVRLRGTDESMMNQYFIALAKVWAKHPLKCLGLIGFLATAELLYSPFPALAHHALGGKTPTHAFAGFLSGLAHPIIGIDHLAFVIAAGLLAAAIGRGVGMPIVFVAMSLVGTGLHLMNVNLPAPEWFIALSVLGFGVMLALRHQPQGGVVVGIAAIAGLFHGYAYGESIIGAEMGPLAAYLAGFAVIQLAIAFAAYWIGGRLLSNADRSTALPLRFAGFAICSMGMTFLTTLLVDTVFPA
jgi:urease accessory protein